MSTLLDEAIVDATELKKAALKNAENTILEKYSEEIKDTVSILLEQEGGLEGFFTDSSVEDQFDVDINQLSVHDSNVVGQIPFIGSELLGKNGSNTHPSAPDSGEDYVEFELDLETLAASLDFEKEDEEAELSIEDQPQEDLLTPAIPEDTGLGQAPSGLEGDMAAEMAADQEFPAEAGDIPDEVLQEAIDILISEEDEQAIKEEILESLDFDYEPKPTGWGFGANTPTSYKLEANELATAVEELEEENKNLKKKNKEQEEEYGELRESFDILENIHQDLKDKNLKLMQLAKKLERKLNEVNLVNAKLTYTNRALNSSSLNERQKEKLVESISKANTIEEAKVIFDTLKDAVGSFSNNEKKPKSLSEAISRPASPFFPKRETSESNEQKIFANRMKRLAGINS